MAHHKGVEDEVAQQHADAENEDGAVRSEHSCGRMGKVIEVHRPCHEPVEQGHEHAGHDRKDDALLRVGVLALSRFLHFAGGYSVADDGDHDQRDTEEEHHRITLRCADVVHYHAKHQREADSQRERHGEARYRGRGGEQYVGSVENDASEYHTEDAGDVRLGKVCQEMTSLGAETAHCE